MFLVYDMLVKPTYAGLLNSITDSHIYCNTKNMNVSSGRLEKHFVAFKRHVDGTVPSYHTKKR
jgi:hypothetical protein